jgi:hypothetical protein
VTTWTSLTRTRHGIRAGIAAAALLGAAVLAGTASAAAVPAGTASAAVLPAGTGGGRAFGADAGTGVPPLSAQPEPGSRQAGAPERVRLAFPRLVEGTASTLTVTGPQGNTTGSSARSATGVSAGNAAGTAGAGPAPAPEGVVARWSRLVRAMVMAAAVLALVVLAIRWWRARRSAEAGAVPVGPVPAGPVPAWWVPRSAQAPGSRLPPVDGDDPAMTLTQPLPPVGRR